jgi:hypothetical protein
MVVATLLWRMSFCWTPIGAPVSSRCARYVCLKPRDKRSSEECRPERLPETGSPCQTFNGFHNNGVQPSARRKRSVPDWWPCRCASRSSGSSSNLFQSKIEPPSQKESQRSTVSVPDLCSNLIDTCLAGLQEMHGAFNAQTLEIRHWRFPQDVL